MHRLLLPLSTLLLAGAATLVVATPAFAAGGPYRAAALPITAPAASADVEPIPGQYLVSMRAAADTNTSLKALNLTPRHKFDGGLNGFAAKLTPAQLKALAHNADVAGIEQDAWHHNVLDLTQTPVPSWGIDQTNLPLSNTYSYFSDGARVHAYIIDTGIDPTHPDFGRRATFDFNSVDITNTDPNLRQSRRDYPISGVTKGFRLWVGV